MGIGHIHMREIERAKAEDPVEPDWSNMMGMPLRIGASSLEQTTKGYPSFSEQLPADNEVCWGSGRSKL